MKYLFILSLLSASFVSYANAELTTKIVEYNKGQFEGYLAMPKEVMKSTPAILLVHNWMGVSEETKFQAQRFAGLGYIVLAADIYGKGQRPKDATEAGKFAGKYKGDRQLFRKNLIAALDFLKEQKNVDQKKLAAIGYCFGGTGAIELARSGAAIKAAVSFHGGLDSLNPRDGKNIKAKLLIHHGDVDPFVPAKDIDAFEREMKDHKVSYEMIRYPGAVHSFTEKGAGDDPKKGAAYNKDADEKSFAKTKEFFRELFQ